MPFLDVLARRRRPQAPPAPAAPPAVDEPPPAAVIAPLPGSDVMPAGVAEARTRIWRLSASNAAVRRKLGEAVEVVGEVVQGMRRLAVATESARNASSAMSEAIDGMRVSSLTISDQVNRSTRVAEGVNGFAARARDGVQGLGEAVNEIGAIVDLIAGLARQTNLLALNAAIEAARAGEAGRGFSVVAAEVKVLAAATKAATDQIGSLIHRVRESAWRSIDDVGALDKAIAELTNAFGTVAHALEVQTESASEIAASSREASRIAALVEEERDRVATAGVHGLAIITEAGEASRAGSDAVAEAAVLLSQAGPAGTESIGPATESASPVGRERPRSRTGRLVLPDRVLEVGVYLSQDDMLEIRADIETGFAPGRIATLQLEGVGLVLARVLRVDGGTLRMRLETADAAIRSAVEQRYEPASPPQSGARARTM